MKSCRPRHRNPDRTTRTMAESVRSCRARSTSRSRSVCRASGLRIEEAVPGPFEDDEQPRFGHFQHGPSPEHLDITQVQRGTMSPHRIGTPATLMLVRIRSQIVDWAPGPVFRVHAFQPATPARQATGPGSNWLSLLCDYPADRQERKQRYGATASQPP